MQELIKALPSISPKDLRVKEVRTLLNYPLDLVKEWLHSRSVTSPSELHSSKIDELVKTMCLAWAGNKFGHPDHCLMLGLGRIRYRDKD